MRKKIAVLIRNRQGEALRMSVGLTLVDDIVDVYLIDQPLEHTDENLLNFELMKEMGMNLYSNIQQTDEFQYVPLPELSTKLSDYNHVFAY